MADWPSVQISAPADHATIQLAQYGPSSISCVIDDPSGGRVISLTNCAASSDCLTLAAQTKWLFFTVNVSVDLAMVDPTQATVTINADGTTVHQISQVDFDAAAAFVAACKLPSIAPSFTVGRIQEPHP